MKITNIILSTALGLALPLAAQTAKPAPSVPVITDAQRADFFKAQSRMQAASDAAKDEQTKFQTELDKLRTACGETSTLQLNQSGDPVCIAKPSAAKK